MRPLAVAVATTAAAASVYLLLRERNGRRRRSNRLVDGAMTLLASGDSDAAADALDAAIELQPELRGVLWQRGLALFFSGRYAEAASQFELDINTNDSDAEEVVFHALSVAHATAERRLPSPLLECGADPRGATWAAIKQLYSGTMTPDAVLAVARHASGPAVRLKVGEYSEEAAAASGATTDAATDALCAAHYYIGAYYEATDKEGMQLDAMLSHFGAAAAAPSSDFMGRIAVMHHRRAVEQAEAAKAVPRVGVGGYACPRVIIGGWQLSAGHSSHPEGNDLAALRLRCQRDLAAHVSKGLTSFDFGDIYTGVELVVGRFVRDHIAAGGRRKDLLLHTKLVPDLDRLATYSAADVRAVVERSCARLATSYVDLVQFHWWHLGIKKYVEVALHLTELKREGLVREVGLTNFALAPTREMVDAGVPIAATQVQLSLLDRRAEASGLSAYCQAKGIQILPYGVLAGGLLSDRYLGAPPPPSDPTLHETRSLTKYLLIVEEAGGWGCLQALLRRLRAVADMAGEGQTIASVAVAWALSRPAVGSVIIGARGQGKIESTLACARLRLSDALLAECTAAAEETLRPVPGEVYSLEREREGKHGRIMRYNLQAMSGEPMLKELEERARAARMWYASQHAAATSRHWWVLGLTAASAAARCVAARRFNRLAAAIRKELEALMRNESETPAVRVRAAQLFRELGGAMA